MKSPIKVQEVTEGVEEQGTLNPLLSKRNLEIKECNQISDCFTCRGLFNANCVWDNNNCNKKQTFDRNDLKWWQNYDSCPDDKKLCIIASQNKTYYEFMMKPQKLGDDIPANYFCKYQLSLEPDVRWQLSVIRFNSF